MSTRSTTHFTYGNEVVAIIYRHSDGYPDGAGADLLRFIEETGALKDPRHDDASFLAARYVVFLAREFNKDYRMVGGRFVQVPNESPLDFLSVGVVSEDPGDIEYRYVVDCEQQPLQPRCYEVEFDNKGSKLVADWPPVKQADHA